VLGEIKGTSAQLSGAARSKALHAAADDRPTIFPALQPFINSMIAWGFHGLLGG